MTDKYLDLFQLPESFKPLEEYNLLEKTCSLYKVYNTNYNDDIGTVYSYFENDCVKFQKVRLSKGLNRGNNDDSKFIFLGDRAYKKSSFLYGQWLFKEGGRELFIFEGEKDALSSYQMLKCPCVSLPNGSDLAAFSFNNNIAFLNNFDSITICFDMDMVGLKGLLSVKDIFPFRVNFMIIEEKDASDMLCKHKQQAFERAAWNPCIFDSQSITRIKIILNSFNFKNGNRLLTNNEKKFLLG